MEGGGRVRVSVRKEVGAGYVKVASLLGGYQEQGLIHNNHYQHFQITIGGQITQRPV